MQSQQYPVFAKPTFFPAPTNNFLGPAFIPFQQNAPVGSPPYNFMFNHAVVLHQFFNQQPNHPFFMENSPIPQLPPSMPVMHPSKINFPTQMIPNSIAVPKETIRMEREVSGKLTKTVFIWSRIERLWGRCRHVTNERRSKYQIHFSFQFDASIHFKVQWFYQLLNFSLLQEYDPDCITPNIQFLAKGKLEFDEALVGCLLGISEFPFETGDIHILDNCQPPEKCGWEKEDLLRSTFEWLSEFEGNLRNLFWKTIMLALIKWMQGSISSISFILKGAIHLSW
jgi:hypothetical protein